MTVSPLSMENRKRKTRRARLEDFLKKEINCGTSCIYVRKVKVAIAGVEQRDQRVSVALHLV